jgi:hypothetical protein
MEGNQIGCLPMSTSSTRTESLHVELDHPTRGVVGLVDELLRQCPEEGLRLDRHANGCRIRAFNDGSEDLLEKPLSKSVFRALLARIAALCNERTPNSVSPLGGKGELEAGTSPPEIFRVEFVNTPDDQGLTLVRVGPPANGAVGDRGND